MELNRLILFEGMGEAEIAAIAARLTMRECPADEVICDEGEEGGSLFIIASGQAVVLKRVAAETEKALGMVQEGEFFGEMSLIEPQVRSARVIAGQGTRLLVLTRADFEALVNDEPRLAVRLIANIARAMARRLNATNEQVAELVAWGLGATAEGE